MASFQLKIPQLKINHNIVFHHENCILTLEPESVEFLKRLDLLFFMRIRGNYTDTIVVFSDDVITHPSEIEFEITLLDKNKREIESIFNLPKNTIFEDYEKVFENGEFSDATIQCNGGRIIDVHRAILSARSEVFKDIFSEKKVVNVKCEFDKTVMWSVLMFIYSGKAHFKNRELDVFLAADHFKLPRLKVLSKISIFEKTWRCNAVSNLVLADSHGADMLDLKKNILTYIKLHAAEVSENLELSGNISLDLMMEIMHALGHSLKPNNN